MSSTSFSSVLAVLSVTSKNVYFHFNEWLWRFSSTFLKPKTCEGEIRLFTSRFKRWSLDRRYFYLAGSDPAIHKKSPLQRINPVTVVMVLIVRSCFTKQIKINQTLFRRPNREPFQMVMLQRRTWRNTMVEQSKCRRIHLVARVIGV